MNEAQLELAIMELFQDEGYEYIRGNTVMRELRITKSKRLFLS